MKTCYIYIYIVVCNCTCFDKPKFRWSGVFLLVLTLIYYFNKWNDYMEFIKDAKEDMQKDLCLQFTIEGLMHNPFKKKKV